MKERYVAYVSCYTQETKDGIKIFDVDMKNGTLQEKDSVQITNSSYITITHDRKHLYSITDHGVEEYNIGKDGDLSLASVSSINGMRGCYLSTDYEEKFLFVAGYHDGKITVLSLEQDGSIGHICEEVYHKGLGSVVDRNFRPHVNCVKMTRDNKYLLAADLGMDHTKVYELDHKTGKLKLVDILHSEQYSGPRHIKISKDGKFIYIIHEASCMIDIYTYAVENGTPHFDKIESVPTINDYHAGDSAASALNLSTDYKFLVCSNVGDNSAVLFKMNAKTGGLEKKLCLPISGSYPKDVALFPDNKHLVSLNHESNTMTFFKVDPDAGTLVMSSKEVKIAMPNCIVFHKLEEA